jgi:hypothetical protein
MADYGNAAEVHGKTSALVPWCGAGARNSEVRFGSFAVAYKHDINEPPGHLRGFFVVLLQFDGCPPIFDGFTSIY